MKRGIIILFFFLAVSLGGAKLAAQQAVIRELSGTVEIRQPGSEVWGAAALGQSLSGDTGISTGFRSSALIGMGDTLLIVRPLTRLTVTEISSSAETETLNLNLHSGRVRADINPPPGNRTSMTVTSPMAVAGARGTIFEFDTLSLEVQEGTVEFVGSLGAPYLVDAGRSSQVDQISRHASSPYRGPSELRPQLPIAAGAMQVLPRSASTSPSPSPEPSPTPTPPGPPSTPPSGGSSGGPAGGGSVDFIPDIQF